MKNNPFIGTWKLQSWITQTSNGETIHPLGENPIGYIMYNTDGYMSVAIMQANRPKFATNEWLSGTTEEQAEAFASYASYCGKYEIKANEGKIIHHPEVIIMPNQTNVPQERSFEFKNNKLILGGTVITSDGIRKSSTLVWQKV